MSSVPASGVISFGNMRASLGRSTGVVRMSDVIQSQANIPGRGTGAPLRMANVKGTSSAKAIFGMFRDDTQNMVTGIYSVRLINASYMGPVVNVMRTSDNSTIDLWADYNGSLKTSQGQTYAEWVGTGMGYVIIWYDQSGYARDAIGTWQCGAIPPQLSLDPTKLSSKYSIQFINRYDPILVVSPYFSYPSFNSSGGTAPLVLPEAGYVAFAPGNVGTAASGSQFYNFGAMNFNVGTVGFSCSCTFMFRGPAGVNERIFDFGSGTPNNNIALARWSTQNSIYLTICNGSTHLFYSQTNTQFEFNQIYNVCMVYNPTIGVNGTLYQYINGVLDSIYTPSSKPIDRICNTCYVGRSWWTSDGAFNGNIYSLHVWNRVLSPTEISAMASAASYLTSQSQMIYVHPFRTTPGYNATGGTLPNFNTTNGFINFTPGVTTRSDAVGAQFMNFGTQTFAVGTAGFSVVCAFMFRDSTVGDWERLIDFGNGPSYPYILVTRFTTTGQIRFVIVENGVVYACMPTMTLLQNTLYEVACVYDPNAGPTGCMYVYIDGILRQSIVPPVKFTNRTLNNCYVGRSAFGSDRAFQGRIYFLHVWNRAITPQEVWTASRICDVVPYSGFNVMSGITDQFLSLTWRGVYPPGGVNSTNGTPPSLDVVNRWFVFNPGNVASNNSSCQYYDFGTRRFPCGTLGFTIIVEFMFTSSGVWERILDFGNGADADNILLARESTTNNLRFAVRNGGPELHSAPFYLTTSVALNTWYRATLVYDPNAGSTGTLYGYLNDVLVTTQVLTAKMNDRTLTRTFVGRSNWDPDVAFNGRIRQFHWWNRVLTLREITSAMGSCMMSYNLQSAVSSINPSGNQDIALNMFNNVSMRVPNNQITSSGGGNDFMNGGAGFGYHNADFRNTSPFVTVSTKSWNTLCLSRNSGTMLFNQIGYMPPWAYAGAVSGNFNGYMNDLIVFSESLPTITSAVGTSAPDYVMFMKTPHIPLWRNGLVGAYFAENWLGSAGAYPWLDISGFGQHVGTTAGTITQSANAPVDVVGGGGLHMLSGPTTASMTFPNGVLPQTYTVIHLARYNGATRGRIIQAVVTGTNWLSGHYAGRSGVAYHNKWITQPASNNIHGDAWVLSTDHNTLYRSLTANRTTDNVAAAVSYGAPLTINGLAGELSDWAVACLIVYNRNLPISEYLAIEDYLASRYRLPVPIQEGLVLSLDAADYVSGSSTWNDRSGNGYNFTLNNTGAYVGTRQVPYMAFNDAFGSTTRTLDVPYSTYNTLIAFTAPLNTNTNWRTLTRGKAADHHVIIQVGTHNLGMFDNDTSVFVPCDNNVDISTLPNVFTRFNMWVFLLSSVRPYYVFYYNPSSLPMTPVGIITSNVNAAINNGFANIGGNVGGNGQSWGNIGTFLWYNRKLSEQEIVETYWRYAPKYNGVIQNNITVCYAMRVKVETYTGPVVRVRRSTDGIQADFFTDETQTFLTTGVNCTGISYDDWIVGGATGFVRIWYDQSGRGNNLVNNVDNLTQPRLSRRSGKWVIQFNASDATVLSFTNAITPNTVLAHIHATNASYGTLVSTQYNYGVRFGSAGTNIQGDSTDSDWHFRGGGTRYAYVNSTGTWTMILNEWVYLQLSVQTPTWATTATSGVSSSFIKICQDNSATSRSFSGFMNEFICHNTPLAELDLVNYFSSRVVSITSATTSSTIMSQQVSRLRFGSVSNATVTSARGIYACWRVQDGYSGPVMAVRRGSDNATVNLYDDGAGSLVTNTGIQVIRWLNGSNAFVTTWYDQSGRGRHAVQTSTGAQPAYDTNTKNMVFNGSSQFFNLPDATLPIGNNNYTIMARHDFVNIATLGGIISAGTNTANNALSLHVSNSNFYQNIWWGNDVNAGTYTKGNTVTCSYNNTSGRNMYVNGVLVGSNSSLSKNTLSTNNTIGVLQYQSNSWLNGQLRYVYVFGSALSDNDRNIIENSVMWMPSSSLVYAPPSYYGMSLYLDASRVESYPGYGITWTDLSGCGNHMALTNCTYSTEFGTPAIRFNGSTSSGYRATYSMQPTSQFTAMSLVYVRGGYDGTFFTLALNSTNVNRAGGWCLHMFFDWDGAVGFSGSLTTPGVRILNPGWYHLCFVKNGLSGTFYMNGQANGMHVAERNVQYNNFDFTIGRDPRDNNKYLNADLVNLSIHNYAMSPQEIMSQYLAATNGGITGLPSSASSQSMPTTTVGNTQPYVMAAVSASARSACRAIYGFKLFNPLHTSAVIQLRRSSDNNLQDFFADAYGNLGTLYMARGTSYASWLGTANAFVRTLYDQSGNGLNLAQTTDSLQPQFFAMTTSEESYMHLFSTRSMTASNVFTTSTITNMQAFFRSREVNRTANMYISFNGLNGAYDGNRTFMHTPWNEGTWYWAPGSSNAATATGITSIGQRVVVNIYKSSSEGRGGFRLNQGTTYNTTMNDAANVSNLVLNSVPGGATAFTCDHWFYGLFVFNARQAAADESIMETMPWAGMQQYQVNPLIRVPASTTQNYVMNNLNSSTVSGCRAAYGFRLLTPNYTGAIVEVRRTLDNTYALVYADALGNLGLGPFGTGTSLNSWLQSTNGFIRRWYDQSGIGNDLVQNTEANQPRIILGTGDNTAVHFVGSTQNLAGGNVFSNATTNSMHVVFASREISRKPNILVSLNGTSFGSTRVFFHAPWDGSFSSGTRWYFFGGNQSNTDTTQSPDNLTAVGQRSVCSAYKSTVDNRVGMRVNQGTRYLSTSNSTATVSGGLILNGSTSTENSDHYLYGLFVFPSRVTPVEEAVLETLPWTPTFPTVPRDGLTCWLDFSVSQSYPGFGNVVYDLSGCGNDFNIVGSGYSWDPLGFINLSSATTYALGPPSSSFNIQADHTVEIVCMPISNANNVLFQILSPTSNRTLQIHLPWSDNNIYWDSLWPDSGINRINYLTTTAVNVLKHYVFRCRMDGTPNREVFENAISIANSGTTRTNLGTNMWGGSSILFNWAGGGGNQWLGRFYYIRIYNRALSNLEILNNFNVARSRYTISQTISPYVFTINPVIPGNTTTSSLPWGTGYWTGFGTPNWLCDALPRFLAANRMFEYLHFVESQQEMIVRFQFQADNLCILNVNNAQLGVNIAWQTTTTIISSLVPGWNRILLTCHNSNPGDTGGCILSCSLVANNQVLFVSDSNWRMSNIVTYYTFTNTPFIPGNTTTTGLPWGSGYWTGFGTPNWLCDALPRFLAANRMFEYLHFVESQQEMIVRFQFQADNLCILNVNNAQLGVNIAWQTTTTIISSLVPGWNRILLTCHNSNPGDTGGCILSCSLVANNQVLFVSDSNWRMSNIVTYYTFTNTPFIPGNTTTTGLPWGSGYWTGFGTPNWLCEFSPQNQSANKSYEFFYFLDSTTPVNVRFQFQADNSCRVYLNNAEIGSNNAWFATTTVNASLSVGWNRILLNATNDDPGGTGGSLLSCSQISNNQVLFVTDSQWRMN